MIQQQIVRGANGISDTEYIIEGLSFQRQIRTTIKREALEALEQLSVTKRQYKRDVLLFKLRAEPTIVTVYLEEDFGSKLHYTITVYTDLLFNQPGAWEKLVHVPERSGAEGSIYVETPVLGSMGDVSWNGREIERETFDDVEAELYPDVDLDVLIPSFLENPARLLAVLGPPGVGKTSLIKHMLKRYNIESAIHIDNPEAAAAPGTWHRAVSQSNCLTIMDDIYDGFGGTDPQSRDPLMRSFLGNSDSVFPNRLKVVLTSNKSVEDLDPALVRSGRCYAAVTFNPLPMGYARYLWQKQGIPGELKDYIDNRQEEVGFGGNREDKITQANFVAARLAARGGMLNCRPYLRTISADQII